jgi:hypothetical protein
MKIAVRLALGSFALVTIVRADEARRVSGRVVDERGQPVTGAAVSYFWCGNGPFTGKNGKLYSSDTPEELKVFLTIMGRMRPISASASERAPSPDGDGCSGSSRRPCDSAAGKWKHRS